MEGRTGVLCEYNNKVSHEIWTDGQGLFFEYNNKVSHEIWRDSQGLLLSTLKTLFARAIIRYTEMCVSIV